MSSSSGDWLDRLGPAATLAWTTSISRSRVSTVDGLFFSESFRSEEVSSLESLLSIVQQMKLKKLNNNELGELREVGEGETFSVFQCQYQESVVAIKRIKLEKHDKAFNRKLFQRRLGSVLREILIMRHPPLETHPNIISLLGYGWSTEKQPSPFISVEFASEGSLRKFMKEMQPIETKLEVIGDVGSGLMALHKCGIIHGDLKLDNVVVSVYPKRLSGLIAKISDFGHSILTSSLPDKRAQYFGTRLYNAPEVGLQKQSPIMEGLLHKCDIWAYGLCAWEILADGELFFQPSWQSDPSFMRPSQKSRFLGISASSSSQGPQADSFDENDQTIFANFDPKKVKHLAAEFVKGLRIPGVGFEKGALLPLLKGALEFDPHQRLSDLSQLAVIRIWSQQPGGDLLQSEPATYAMPRDFRYYIFGRDNGPSILWEHQRQLLEELEESAQREQSGGSASFQTLLCYVNAFGTSKDLIKAAKLLQKSDEAGHLVSRALGPRIMSALTDKPCPPKAYSESLVQGLGLARQQGIRSGVSFSKGSVTTEHVNFTHLRDSILQGRPGRLNPPAIGVKPNKQFLVHPHELMLAVERGDIRLVEAILRYTENQASSDSQDESLVILAASRGHGDIVIALLKAEAPITQQNSSSLLHWLFCMDETNLKNIQAYLESQPYDLMTSLANQASAEVITVHPQWPFQIHGTPLATAIAAGNVAAVKLLLKLGADPLKPAFAPSEDDGSSPTWTPIHLAVRYHQAEIFQMLLSKVAHQGTWKPPKKSLMEFPIACALSQSTNAERFAMHGSAHKEALECTLKALLAHNLLCVSSEGRNALTQAIDLEDVATVEILLQNSPTLRTGKIQHPDNDAIFTYPLHFAVQLGSERDTNEAVRILQIILEFDPKAINRRDSSSMKPIHIAAMGMSSRITEFLLDNGASFKDTDSYGRNPLHFCQTEPNAILLFSRGANVQSRDEQGSSPLHAAVQQKSYTMLETLIQAGANIDGKDKNGRTALHLATHLNRSDVIIVLFENGADPFIEDSLGISPFLMSLTLKSANIVSRFQGHRAFESLTANKRHEALHFAASKGQPAPLKHYLGSCFDLTNQSDELPNPELSLLIHSAAYSCRVDLLDVLLARGFDSNAHNAMGQTPLLVTCQTGRADNDVNTTDRILTCQRLLGEGADCFVKDHKGLTPFRIAKVHRDYQLLTMFLEHVLETNSLNSEVLVARSLQCMSDRSTEKGFTNEAQKLIKGETIGYGLIRDAFNKREVGFFTSFIGGHFIQRGQSSLVRNLVKKKLRRSDWGSNRDEKVKRNGWGATALDLLQYYAALKDQRMVRWILFGEGPQQIGLEIELNSTTDKVELSVWPDQKGYQLHEEQAFVFKRQAEVREEEERRMARAAEELSKRKQEWFLSMPRRRRISQDSIEDPLDWSFFSKRTQRSGEEFSM